MQLIRYCYCNPCDPLIKGVSRNSAEQRVSLHVDHPLLYLSNFSLALSLDLIILNLFCTWLYPVEKTQFPPEQDAHLTCPIAKPGFIYLRVTDEIIDLHKDNPAVCCTLQDIQFNSRISRIVFAAFDGKWANLFIFVVELMWIATSWSG